MGRRAAAGAAMAVVLALVAGCGADPGATVAPTASAEPTATSSSTPSAHASTTPGERIEVGPAAGDVVAVVGIAHDGALDLLAAPGGDVDVLASLSPLADDLVAAGESRRLDDSIWYLVTADGRTGWVDGAHVQHLGGVDDATSRVIDLLGTYPSAATMPELGMIVAHALGSTDPPSQIVMSVDATVGDLGEVTYDVLGLGDDAVGGIRLHVFGAPDGDGFVLRSVEETSLCLRGVSDGRCV